GSQYVGMLRDLACRFPRMHEALERWNEAATELPVAISDAIYPPPSFCDEARRNQDERLRDTRFAQPSIGAVSIGLVRVLEDFGVRPTMVAGHSFGELTALCAAGSLDEAALVRLSLARGSLMADCSKSDDPGAMLAVLAPSEEVLRLIAEHQLD